MPWGVTGAMGPGVLGVGPILIPLRQLHRVPPLREGLSPAGTRDQGSSKGSPGWANPPKQAANGISGQELAPAIAAVHGQGGPGAFPWCREGGDRGATLTLGAHQVMPMCRA